MADDPRSRTYLTLVEDDAVCRKVDELSDRHPRFREAYEALKWELARDPAIGFQLPSMRGMFVHKQQGEPFLTLPSITVLYEFDLNRITIHSIATS